MANNGWFKIGDTPSSGNKRPGAEKPGPDPDKMRNSKPEPKPVPDSGQESKAKPAPESVPKPPKASPAPPPKAPDPKPHPPTFSYDAPPKPVPMAPQPSKPAPQPRAVPAPERTPATGTGSVAAPPPGGFPDDTDHSLTVGERGPVLLQDTVLHEHLETFVHSKITERAVHVKGFGAFGYYVNQNSMREYTTAPIFSSTGQQIPVMTRFSLAVSTKGTPDSGRNVRGFSTKFYTGDGVFDLLCNHIPVFLVRDAIRFPESIQAFLPSPQSNLADPERFWGFVAKAPEATHFVTWLYSDVGTVKSLRKIRGYSVNTYVWRNAAGVRRYVKYHWLPKAGEEYIDRQEAGRLAGANPDVAGQDLWDAIASGTPVEYELNVQIMDPDDARNLPFDPMDCTKVWDEEDYPLIPVGRLVLNRNPDDYQEQIEKVAFSPANLMDGIEFSDDKMLQGRSTIYWDAQRYRLGPDFRRIPVNKEAGFVPKRSLPTSGLGEWREGYEMRSELRKPDDFAQAGERYHMLTDAAQERMIDNIASDLHLAKPATRATVIGYLAAADGELGARVKDRTEQYLRGSAQ